MATYQVRGPDGLTYTIQGPEGASQTDVIAAAQQLAANHHKQIAAQVDNDPISQGARNFMDGMSTMDKLRAGAGKAITDLGRGAGQLVGAVSRQDVADSRAVDAPLMATTPGKVGDVLGNVAMLAPTALIPGANTITGGATIGAVTGLLSPSTSTGETLKNVGMGAAGGAAVPAVGQGYRVARAAAEPFYETGRNAIVGRALNRAAGNDSPAVAQRLQEASQPFVGPSPQGLQRTTMGELVPGSMPTVGQAAGNPGVAALERAAVAGNPEMTNAVSQTMQAQNAARVGVLDNLAGTDAQRAAAEAARKGASQDLYQTATRATYPVDEKLADLLQRPAVKQAMERAKVMAANDGRPFSFEVESRTGLGGLGNQSAITSKQITGQGLQDLKMALDDMLSDPASGFAGKAGRQVADLRGQIVGWMEKANPDFKAARDSYRNLSQPLNQMDVAQAIRDRTVSPLNGNLQPASFARTIADEGLPARATGFPGATLDNSVNNAGQNQLQAILADLQRANAAQNAGRGVGSDTVQKLAYSNILDQSGVPTFLRSLSPAQVVGNVLSRGADAAYGRANRELGNRLAEVMLDPGQASQLMFATQPAAASALLQMLGRGASGLAIAAPASANALQQQ